MALVQPTNLFPSSFRGSGGDVIDASIENTFSLQLNGASACVAYSMVIMRNDTNSTVVYSIAKQTLSTPIYPRNYLNEPQRLEIPVPSANGMVNGYANGYKWNVTLYWDNSNSITSADTFFWAQATPYFTVTNNPYTLTAKSVTLEATYSQADNVPLEWYRWTLTDASGNIVADSGEVYSEDIQFTVDGLLNGESFTYLIVGETQSGVSVGGIVDADYAVLEDVNGETLYDVNGVILEEADNGTTHYTNEGQFVVRYDTPVVQSGISATCDNKTGAINLSFNGIRVIQGRASGTISYVENTPIPNETSVIIPSGASIAFDEVNGSPMSLTADTTHIWSGSTTSTSTALYRFTEQTESGSIQGTLAYSDGTLTYSYNGQTILAASLPSISSKWIIAIMRGNSVTVQVWDYASLNPSNTLYPADSIYPGMGEQWNRYGRFTEDLLTMVVGTTTIGTITFSGDNMTFNIETAGNYQMTFTNSAGNPIREALNVTAMEGDRVTIPNPSAEPYVIFCIAYSAGGQYVGMTRFRMNEASGDNYSPDPSTTLTAVALQGTQTTDYVKVIEGTLTPAEKETYLDIAYTDYDKDFDTNTLMFAKFEGNLDAGSYSAGDETLEGWDIYKQEVGASNLRFVTSVDTAQSSITDYLVPNGQPFNYYLFPRGLDKLGSPVVSDTIVSRAWNWVLYEATESESNKNLLNVVNSYVFQGNVDTGSISNNAQSNVLNNFTQYPKILKGTQNYKSGKLSALVGYVDTQGNSYTETSALRNALYALSISQNRMFLKNRAGDIWEVSVHSAISMDVNDTSSYQPHTVSIDWTEIGAIGNISLAAINS